MTLCVFQRHWSEHPFCKDLPEIWKWSLVVVGAKICCGVFQVVWFISKVSLFDLLCTYLCINVGVWWYAVIQDFTHMHETIRHAFETLSAQRTCFWIHETSVRTRQGSSKGNETLGIHAVSLLEGFFFLAHTHTHQCKYLYYSIL